MPWALSLPAEASSLPGTVRKERRRRGIPGIKSRVPNQTGGDFEWLSVVLSAEQKNRTGSVRMIIARGRNK